MLRIDDIKAHGLACLAQAGINAEPRTNKACPACGGKDRFTLFESGRHYCRQCGPGDALDLIQKVYQCDLKAVLAMLDTGISQPAPAPTAIAKPSEDKQWRIQRILAKSSPIAPGTAAYQYLTICRGFDPGIIPVALLANDAVDYWEESAPGKWSLTGTHPAMIAPVKNTAGDVIAVHITYLNHDGTKATVNSPKKIIGKCRGGTVQLTEPVDALGFAEGIETAIAASQLFKMPVWATLSASIMPHVELPPGIENFCIFADNDDAGLAAARKLGKRLLDQKKRVSAESPTLTNDYYDLWKLRSNGQQNYTTGS